MVETLYKYLILNNKVAIPGVGTFYIQRQPAYLDFANKQFVSPHRQIAFKENSYGDNSSLYSFLAHEQQIDEHRASTNLHSFSDSFLHELNANGSAELEGIGLLSKTVSGSLAFTQAAQIDSFFPDVPAERVIRSTSQPETILQDLHQQKNPIIVDADEAHEQPATKKDYWWVFATILAIGAIAAIIYYYKQNGNFR